MAIRSIKGIQIEEEDLNPLNDLERKDQSLSYFYGTVTQMAFAETGEEVMEIWQNARKHLKQVYQVSDYAEEDFHVFDMELARCSIQRAAQLEGEQKAREKAKFNYAEEERQEITKLRDEKRKSAAQKLFMESVMALESAMARSEILKIHEKFEADLEAIYDGSWTKKHDQTIWIYLMVKRLARVAARKID
jgi:hypothetical protein